MVKFPSSFTSQIPNSLYFAAFEVLQPDNNSINTVYLAVQGPYPESVQIAPKKAFSMHLFRIDGFGKWRKRRVASCKYYLSTAQLIGPNDLDPNDPEHANWLTLMHQNAWERIVFLPNGKIRVAAKTNRWIGIPEEQ